MRRGRIVALTLVLVALPLMVFMGCSNNPLAPDTTQSNQAGDFFSQTWPEGGLGKTAAAYATLLSLETDMSSNSVEPETGGSVPVDLPSAATGEFKVEPGAQSEAAEVTIKSSELFFEDGTKAVVFECGPDGLVFNPAALMTVDASVLGDGVKFVYLYWLNEPTGEWVPQGKFLVKRDGTVDLPIGHFSRYGISR